MTIATRACHVEVSLGLYRLAILRTASAGVSFGVVVTPPVESFEFGASICQMSADHSQTPHPEVLGWYSLANGYAGPLSAIQCGCLSPILVREKALTALVYLVNHW
jgi:hypothetical protein